MKRIIRTADNKGRVILPGFANATVIIEQVDENEYRIRKAQVIPEKDLQFHEESFPLELVEEDAAAFLKLVNGSRLIGPALAWLLLALAGEGWCFLADAISYIAPRPDSIDC